MNARRLLITSILFAIASTQSLPASACGWRWRRFHRHTHCEFLKIEEPCSGVFLSWKFEKNWPFFQEMTTESVQKMMIQGNKVENKQRQTFYFSWTSKEVDKDGNWKLIQKIEGMKMDFTISGKKVSYDSTKEVPGSDALANFFKALVGSEFTVVLDKKMNAIKVEGAEDFVKKLTKQNPGSEPQPLLRQILNEDTLREMVGQSFASLPAKPIKAGTTWNGQPSKLEMGPVGRYDIGYKYTYKGKKNGSKNLDKIKVDTFMKYTEPGENVGGLPFKIKKAELQPTKSSGVIYFDNTRGRMESSESDMEFKGKLDIEIAGMVTTVDLTQTQKTTIKGLDKNPVEPAKT